MYNLLLTILLIGASAAACDPVKVGPIKASDFCAPAVTTGGYVSTGGLGYIDMGPTVVDTVKVDDVQCYKPGCLVLHSTEKIPDSPPSFIVRVDSFPCVTGWWILHDGSRVMDTSYILDTIRVPKIPVWLDSAEYKAFMELLYPVISGGGWHPAIHYLKD